MKISIITGTFNQYTSLVKLYESLVEQKEYVHEWIVCDDGSTDNTWSFLRGLSNDPIPVQGFSQTHQGMRLARNLNNGLRHATGDLLFFVMGDSYLQKDTLKQLSETYIPGTAGCGFRKNVTANGEYHSRDWRLNFDTRAIFRNVNYAHCTGNSMIVKREDLVNIGYWNEGYEGYGQDDYDVFHRLEKEGIELVLYNNIRINHVYHGEGQPDNPENVKLFAKELNR